MRMEKLQRMSSSINIGKRFARIRVVLLYYNFMALKDRMFRIFFRNFTYRYMSANEVTALEKNMI